MERLLQDPRGPLSPTRELEAKRSPTLLGLHSKGPGQTARADFLLSENVKNYPGSCAVLEGVPKETAEFPSLEIFRASSGCSEYTKAASPQRSPPSPVSQSLPTPAQADHQFTLLGKTCSTSHSPSLSTDKILISNRNYLNISQKDEVPPSEFLMQKPQQVCSQARAHREQNHQPMNTTSSTTGVINHFFH